MRSLAFRGSPCIAVNCPSESRLSPRCVKRTITYVDKTGFIRQSIDQGQYYFLSRPRRFDKSLLLDTLAELFAGNGPLFQGLAIHPHWDWATRFPVIRISFGGGVVHSRAELADKIREALDDNARRLDVAAEAASLSGRFSRLIQAAHAATGRRVVVLVDEYDKPILDNLTAPERARELRDELRNLYSVIKDHDAHVRFAFLTGVSKFKVVELEPEGRALQQIKERGYANKYRAMSQPLHLIGIEFSREQRTLVSFEVETLLPPDW